MIEDTTAIMEAAKLKNDVRKIFVQTVSEILAAVGSEYTVEELDFTKLDKRLDKVFSEID